MLHAELLPHNLQSTKHAAKQAPIQAVRQSVRDG